MYLDLWGYWGFYSSRRLTSLPWCRNLFLIEIHLNSLKRDGQDIFFIKNTFINACIFRNPHCARIPFTLGFYGGQVCVASISHLEFLAATWVLDPSLLHPFMQDSSIIDLAHVGLVLYQPTDVELSSPFHGDPLT